MVPMLITDCSVLMAEQEKFRDRDWVTLCRGKLRRGPIQEIFDDGRNVLIRCRWIAEEGPDGEWFMVSSAVDPDILKSELAVWRGDELRLIVKGYGLAAIMPAGDNLDSGQVKDLVAAAM
ncbi:MAG: hypothetical protein AAB476_01115 [Patescibacteria group bacterium]